MSDELSLEEVELIERLVFFQKYFESPQSSEDQDDIKNSHPSDDDDRYKRIMEITSCTIKLTVEFAKRMPWFDSIVRRDQITLLKASATEISTLITARHYDYVSDSIIYWNDQPYTTESYNTAGLGDCTTALFNFCRQMGQYDLDEVEYALLTTILIFSERPDVTERNKVEQVQDIYLECFRKYEMQDRKHGFLRFARLLSVLTELRTLSSLNSEMFRTSPALRNKLVPHFLTDIWDLEL